MRDGWIKIRRDLLIMTNDGDLINGMMRARHGHEKEYKVTVNKPVTGRFISKLKEGVRIVDKEKQADVATRPCKAEKLGKYTFSITLSPGAEPWGRRMCEALGYKVERLVRVRIMNIELGSLEARRLSKIDRAGVKGIIWTSQRKPECRNS